jgi:hypothetical protein
MKKYSRIVSIRKRLIYTSDAFAEIQTQFLMCLLQKRSHLVLPVKECHIGFATSHNKTMELDSL